MLELLHFIFFFCFVCSFVSNMIVEHGSLSTFTTCQRRNQWGESSMFRIHNSTITGSFFSFSWFFRIVITRKCFCKLALVFAKLMSKKAFCVDVNAEANSYFIDLQRQNFGNKIYFSIIGKNLLAQIRSTWTFNFNF